MENTEPKSQKHLHSGEKDMVYRVYKSCMLEKVNGNSLVAISKCVERTAFLTGLSQNDVSINHFIESFVIRLSSDESSSDSE